MIQSAAGFLPQRPSRCDLRLLLQVANPHRGVPFERSAVWILLPGEDSHQGSLAYPIRPHQANPLAWVYVERDPIQDRLGTVVLSDFLDAEDNHPLPAARLVANSESDQILYHSGKRRHLAGSVNS